MIIIFRFLFLFLIGLLPLGTGRIVPEWADYTEAEPNPAGLEYYTEPEEAPEGPEYLYYRPSHEEIERQMLDHMLQRYLENELLNENQQNNDQNEKEVKQATEKHEKVKKGQDELITFVEQGGRSGAFPKVQVKRSLRVEHELAGIRTHHPVFMGIVVVGTVAAAVAMVGAALVGYRVHQNKKSNEEAQYPQYGVIGPSKDKKSAKKMKQHGDASMAYGAQLHHYQQTKQQIIDMEQPKCEKAAQSDESDGEGEEADYSVYECPGLAPTGNIEIANPLFEGKNGKGSTSSEPDKE